MTISALSVTTIARTGTADTLAAANVDGHTIVNDGKTWFEVLNGAGAPINVIVAPSKTVDGLAVSGRTVAVAAAARKKFGPYPKSDYGESVTVIFSAVTSVTVGAFKLS
jgi:hypothetical protein